MSFLSCLESSSPAGTRGPSDYTCCTRLQVEDTVRASVVSTLHTSLMTSLGAQRRFVQLGSDCKVLAISPWLWLVCPAPGASSPARGTLSSRWGTQLAAGRDPRDLCPSLPGLPCPLTAELTLEATPLPPGCGCATLGQRPPTCAPQTLEGGRLAAVISALLSSV